MHVERGEWEKCIQTAEREVNISTYLPINSATVLHVLSLLSIRDRASATETIDSGSIPGRLILKTRKISTTELSAWFSSVKGQCAASTVCGGQVAAWLGDLKVPSLPPGQGNLLIKCVISNLTGGRPAR